MPPPVQLIPVRLLAQFETSSSRPLVQVTLARREGTRLVGAGTRAVHLTGRPLEIVDAQGHPTGETVTIAHALAVLYSLARRQP